MFEKRKKQKFTLEWIRFKKKTIENDDGEKITNIEPKRGLRKKRKKIVFEKRKQKFTLEWIRFRKKDDRKRRRRKNYIY